MGHAVAEGAATLVRDLAGQHVEGLDPVLALGQPVERPAGTQLGGDDREVRRREAALQHRLGGVPLLRQVELDPGGVAPAEEERDAVRVVPVEVSEQDRAGERLATQQRGHRRDAGAGVEEELRGAVTAGERDARRVAAVPHEVGARRRGGAAHPAERHLHRPGRPRGHAAPTSPWARASSTARTSGASVTRPAVAAASRSSYGAQKVSMSASSCWATKSPRSTAESERAR